MITPKDSQVSQGILALDADFGAMAVRVGTETWSIKELDPQDCTLLCIVNDVCNQTSNMPFQMHVQLMITNGYRNVLREPRVALSLVDPANPYRSLEIRGSVTRIDEDPDGQFADSHSRKYLNRRRNADEIQPGEERVVLVVEPERVNLFPPQADKKESGTSTE